jgi:hypothetical protein
LGLKRCAQHWVRAPGMKVEEVEGEALREEIL